MPSPRALPPGFKLIGTHWPELPYKVGDMIDGFDGADVIADAPGPYKSHCIGFTKEQALSHEWRAASYNLSVSLSATMFNRLDYDSYEIAGSGGFTRNLTLIPRRNFGGGNGWMVQFPGSIRSGAGDTGNYGSEFSNEESVGEDDIYIGSSSVASEYGDFTVDNYASFRVRLGRGVMQDPENSELFWKRFSFYITGDAGGTGMGIYTGTEPYAALTGRGNAMVLGRPVPMTGPNAPSQVLWFANSASCTLTVAQHHGAPQL